MLENKSYHEGTWKVLDSFYETTLSQRLEYEGLEYEDARDNEIYLPYYYDALRDVRSSHPDFTFENEEIDFNTKDLWVKEKQEELSKMNVKEDIHEQTQQIDNKNKSDNVRSEYLQHNEARDTTNKMVNLQGYYKKYSDLLKKEKEGEITEEKVVNRLNAENTYEKSKKDLLENSNITKEDIKKMERKVDQKETLKQSKKKGRGLSM